MIVSGGLFFAIYFFVFALGQASGPILGSVLFAWQINVPYLATATLLVAVALVVGRKAMETPRDTKLALSGADCLDHGESVKARIRAKKIS
jgi:MFS family permease